MGGVGGGGYSRARACRDTFPATLLATSVKDA